jgi:hypothetical protein
VRLIKYRYDKTGKVYTSEVNWKSSDVIYAIPRAIMPEVQSRE